MPLDAAGESTPLAVGHPTQLAVLGASDLVRLITAFRDGMRANQAAINALNVYPVPDGDTGTNMALTVESVVAELESVLASKTSGAAPAADLARRSTDTVPGEPEMGVVCHGISHGSLMGARGNSGVILSQILRGIAGVARELQVVGPHDLAAALVAASTGAYGAVLRPIEGTILTVVRCASEGAADAAGRGDSLVDVALAARQAAQRGLDQTPELLPVLKAAGVVDAGGVGLCVLLDALLFVIDGRPIPPVALPEGMSVSAATTHGGGHGLASSGGGDGSGSSGNIADLRYEVMYFLEAPDASVPAFKDAWAAIGDSIVVVGGDGLWNCHIHTDDIGAAIEAAIDIGRPRKIRVTDLLDELHELEEERWVREATGESRVEEPPHVHEPVDTAVVAVATGDGIKRLFWSLGVQQVVTGGQSMNPSTAQLLDAVNACPADSVVILPNNKNIIPVAEQVAPLTSKIVRVIGTRGISEGLAAAMAYDPVGTADDNASEMRMAAASIVSGEVTVAVRDTTSDAGPIRVGDHLGIARDGGIVAVAPGLVDACTLLLDRIVTDRHEIVSIIEGVGASAADTRKITEWIADHRPGCAAEVHHGGQPLYPYLFGAE
jgi:uncharacterized protein